VFRPWHIWTAFGLCLAVAFLALVWVSKAALRLDRNEQLARKTARRRTWKWKSRSFIDWWL